VKEITFTEEILKCIGYCIFFDPSLQDVVHHMAISESSAVSDIQI
jgi:hypothetical protein